MFGTFIPTKIGELYPYSTEEEMLKEAKSLDEQGYKLHLYRDKKSKNFPFKIKVIDYKYNNENREWLILELRIYEEKHIINLERGINTLLKNGWKVVNVFSRGDYVCAAVIKE